MHVAQTTKHKIKQTHSSIYSKFVFYKNAFNLCHIHLFFKCVLASINLTCTNPYYLNIKCIYTRQPFFH